MRATIHNGRTSKDGAYNTKHNDRQFDIRNAEQCQKAEKRAADLQSILTAAERRQVEQIRQEQEREQKQFEDDEWEIE